VTCIFCVIGLISVFVWVLSRPCTAFSVTDCNFSFKYNQCRFCVVPDTPTHVTFGGCDNAHHELSASAPINSQRLLTDFSNLTQLSLAYWMRSSRKSEKFSRFSTDYHRPSRCSDKTLNLYSEGAWFEYRSRHRVAWFCSWFSSVPPVNCRETTSFMSRTSPFKSFSVHYSSVIPFDAMWS
jgi:hypothetical protein